LYQPLGRVVNLFFKDLCVRKTQIKSKNLNSNLKALKIMDRIRPKINLDIPIKPIEPELEYPGLEDISVVRYSLEDLLHPEHKTAIRLGMLKLQTLSYNVQFLNGQNQIARFTKYLCSETIFQLIKELTESRDYDLIVGPEYSFFPGNPLTNSEKNNYLERLAQLSEKTSTAIIPGTFVGDNNGNLINSAFVFQGSEIYEYRKTVNGGEERFAKFFSLRARFGTEKGVFELFGYDCGIEICADSRTLFEKIPASSLDLQFLLACQGMTTKFDPLKHRGYGIRNDGYKDKSRDPICHVSQKTREFSPK
jgi:hypothetical protein